MLSTKYEGKINNTLADGKGRLDAVSNAIKECYKLDYELTNYVEHNLESTSKAEAAAYVSVKFKDKEYWGTGIHDDIICASIYALISALNNAINNQ